MKWLLIAYFVIGVLLSAHYLVRSYRSSSTNKYSVKLLTKPKQGIVITLFMLIFSTLWLYIEVYAICKLFFMLFKLHTKESNNGELNTFI